MPSATDTPPLNELADDTDTRDWDPAVDGAFADAASDDEPETIPYTPTEA
jgi:hypothetical protein